MRKTGLQILAEIREAMEVINGKMAEVELQLAELEGFMDFDEAASPELEPEPEPEPVVEPEPVAEPAPVADPAPAVEEASWPARPAVSEPVVEPERVAEPEPAPVPEPAAYVPEPDFDPAPVFEPEPVQPAESINEAAAARPKAAVIDVMAEKCAWKTDIPGSPVRNIISGISLNDRILFINTLFKGDAQAFQATIALFNSYESLSQAEEFIRSNYPGWNLDSEVVYRFMMAVRRKLGK